MSYYRAPKDAKMYHKIGVAMADWELNYFKYLSNGFTTPQISSITGIPKRKYESTISRLKDDLSLSTTIELVSFLIRKKIIK